MTDDVSESLVNEIVRRVVGAMDDRA
ncbi:hypothetical protein LCGC14_2717550, partial [marine sediment metagenome]